MKAKKNTIDLKHLNFWLDKIDYAPLPKEHQPLGKAFSETLSLTIYELTNDFITRQYNLNDNKLLIHRSMLLGNQLSLLATSSIGVFYFGFFGWLVDFIKSLFDDEDIDVAIGTIDGPEGIPLHGGVGIEINIDPEEDNQVIESPDNSPFEFDKPEEEPRIKIKLMGIYNLDSLGNYIPSLPSGGLSDFSFPFPDLEPGESGFGFSIEFKF